MIIIIQNICQELMELSRVYNFFMSRSHPWKLKPKKTKFTILACGEGQTEEAFLRYLGSLFISRESGVSIKYHYVGGKDPAYMIDKIIKYGASIYDKVFILLDNDKIILNTVLKKAKDHNIQIIKSIPCCIEGLFLSILKKDFKLSGKNSKQCKKEFEDNYSKKINKVDYLSYNKIFYREKIELACLEIKTIKDLLIIFKRE